MGRSIMGDVLGPTTGSHGTDISSQRLDDLDRECVKFALDCALRGVAVDLGCGYGAQGFRLGSLGMNVCMYDRLDIAAEVEAFNRILRLGGRVRFCRKDIAGLDGADLPERVDVLYSQRFLHYLPFGTALRVLSLLAERMPPGGGAFLSASGVESELGIGYPDAAKAAEDRYARVEPGVAEKHFIHGDVCLYRESEFASLCSQAGLTVVSIGRSPLGNIKGAFRR